MTFEFIMWYRVEKFLQKLQLCFQDLFDHGSYAWVMNIMKIVVECKFKAIMKGNQLVFNPWYISLDKSKGTPMLVLLQIIGFETMVLWLSNRFDLETHQKVNICIFTYKFVFCTRWAQFSYFSFIIYLFFDLGLVRRGELGSLLWLVFLWLVWWLKEKSPLSKVWVDLMTISLMWS